MGVLGVNQNCIAKVSIPFLPDGISTHRRLNVVSVHESRRGGFTAHVVRSSPLGVWYVHAISRQRGAARPPKRSQGPALLFRSGCQRLGPLRQAPSILSFSHDPGSVLAFVQRRQFCQRYAVVDDDCSIPGLEPRGTLDAGELLVFVDIRHVVRDWRVTIENGRTNRDLFRRAVKWVVS
jgi:hypothetical protein